MERDSQRSKVYKAENVVDRGKKFITIAEVETYCSKMVNSKWWKETYPKITTIRVGDGRRRSRAQGYRSGMDTIRIDLPRHSRTELIILHEVAHGLIPSNAAWHGKQFCGEYLRIVHRFMGANTHKALLDSFDVNGVVYTEPPQKIPESKYKDLVKLSWAKQPKDKSSYTPEYRNWAMMGEHHVGTVAKDPKWTENKYRAWCYFNPKRQGTIGLFETEAEAMKVIADMVNLWVYKAGLAPTKS